LLPLAAMLVKDEKMTARAHQGMQSKVGKDEGSG